MLIASSYIAEANRLGGVGAFAWKELTQTPGTVNQLNLTALKFSFSVIFGNRIFSLHKHVRFFHER